MRRRVRSPSGPAAPSPPAQWPHRPVPTAFSSSDLQDLARMGRTCQLDKGTTGGAGWSGPARAIGWRRPAHSGERAAVQAFLCCSVHVPHRLAASLATRRPAFGGSASPEHPPPHRTPRLACLNVLVVDADDFKQLPGLESGREEGQAVPPGAHRRRPPCLASRVNRSVVIRADLRLSLQPLHNGAEHAFPAPLTRPDRRAAP